MLTEKGPQANSQNETGPGSEPGNRNGQGSGILDQQSSQRKSRNHETDETHEKGAMTVAIMCPEQRADPWGLASTPNKTVGDFLIR